MSFNKYIDSYRKFRDLKNALQVIKSKNKEEYSTLISNIDVLDVYLSIQAI